MEAASGDDEQERAHGEQNEGVGPEMNPTGAAKNDAASDVDEVSGGNKKADVVEEFGHGFAGKDVAGEKDAGKNGEKGELHGVSLRSGLAGNENAERERNEDVRQGEEGQKDDAAVNGDLEEEAHGGDDHEEFEKADAEVGEEFAKQQAHGANGGDEELLESAAFFFANDGEGGEEGGDVQEKDGGEAGQEEVRGARIGIKENFRAHFDGERGAAGGQDAAKGFIETDGGGHVNGLSRDGRVGTVDEDENLGGHAMEKLVGIIDGNFEADAALAGNDGVVEVVVVVDIAVDPEGVGVFKAIEEFAGFAAAVGVVDHGIDLADVGVDAVAEKQHLQDGDDEREEEGGEIAADMEGFFVKDGAKAAERIKHWEPPERRCRRPDWPDDGR